MELNVLRQWVNGSEIYDYKKLIKDQLIVLNYFFNSKKNNHTLYNEKNLKGIGKNLFVRNLKEPNRVLEYIE